MGAITSAAAPRALSATSGFVFSIANSAIAAAPSSASVMRWFHALNGVMNQARDPTCRFTMSLRRRVPTAAAFQWEP